MEYLRSSDFIENGERIVGSYTPRVPTDFQLMGTSIDLPPYTFDVIPAPGHTSDSILLYEPSQKRLFTGDALYDGELYADLPTSDRQAWLETLSQIDTLAPGIVFPGHNKILQDSNITHTLIATQKTLS